MWTAALAVPAVLLVAALVLPLAGLLLTASPAEIAGGFGHPLVWPALRISLVTTAIAVVFIVVAGTPLAWFLARWRTRTGSVSRPFSSVQALNGDRLGPVWRK